MTEGPKAIIVGAGYFGRHWMRVMAGRRDCRLAAIVATDEESLRGALVEWPHGPEPKAYQDLSWAIDLERPEFAIVAVPEDAHRAVLCRLIGAGIHCLCEKPLATTRDDAAAILAAHRERPEIAVMIDQQFRWRPSIQRLREVVRSGVLGNLGDMSILHRQDIRRTTVGGWRERMEHPYLFDMAVHFFDLVRYLTGEEAETVYANAHRPGWSMFEGRPAMIADIGLTGSVHAEVSGTFVARGFQTVQEGLITVAGDQATVRYGEDGRLRLYRDGPAEELEPIAMTETDCDYSLSHFLSCVRTGQAPATGLVDNMRTFEIVLAAAESCRTGCRVSLERAA